MIHEASAVTQGDAEEHRARAELLESMSEEIAAIYAERGNYDRAVFRDLMQIETWLDADDAVALGLADEKFDTKTKDKAMNIIDRLTKPSGDEAQAKIDALENEAQAHDEQVAEFEAKLSTAESALQESTEKLVELQASKDSAEELNAELESKVAELENKIQVLTEEAEASDEAKAEVIEKLEVEAEETKEKVDARASEILAEQGHPAPVAIEENAVSADDIRAEFAKMQPGTERSAFFQAHKDVLKVLS